MKPLMSDGLRVLVCGACSGSGFERYLGRDNDEVVIDCSVCWGSGLSRAAYRVLDECTLAHDACARISRPYGGEWSGDIGLRRALEGRGLMTFISLHRGPDNTLWRRSTITRAGLNAIRCGAVLGMPPKGHEDIAVRPPPASPASA